MRHRLAGVALAIAVAAFGVAPSAGYSADGAATDLQARLNRLEAEVTAAEDLSALKRMQRAYGYYLDKGMWEDLQAFFTDDAVANYPAGIYVGHESIRKHLFLNVGGRNGAIGLGNNRLYDPHAAAAGGASRPRRQDREGPLARLAMFGSLGGGATWAEGVYELQYAKVNGVWKISKLDYYSGFGAPYAPPGWVRAAAALRRPPAASRRSAHRGNSGSPPRRALSTSVRPRTQRWTATASPQPASRRSTTKIRAARCSGGHGLERRVPCSASVKGRGDASKRAADLLHRAGAAEGRAGRREPPARLRLLHRSRAVGPGARTSSPTTARSKSAQQGVYVGKKRVREFLGTAGPARPRGRLAQRPHPAAAPR